MGFFKFDFAKFFLSNMGFRYIMMWEVSSSSKAAQIRLPIRKPGITSDRQKTC